MRIQKLEISGFKSFKDRTVIQFDHGITGIVGPNGCGKSNIVDALTWVMGEQSAKHLRGSSMEDVIFAGAEGYAPMGMAEVSLTLENDGGPFPVKWARHSEIMITRRLHRSGESEYLINKEPARLRDIQEVFMDTGVGAKGFSIIEQGAIGKIITAKPEDRRYLIEEAAGITKFKVRKRESEKKLQATDQNLVRLNDIVGELKRQLDSLQRQAKKAERYREIRNQVKELDLILSSHRWMEFKTDLESVQAQLAEAQTGEVEAQAHISTLESQVQQMRLDLAELEKKVNTLQTQRFESQSEVQKKESEIQRLEMQIEQARQNEVMTGNLLQELEAKKALLSQDVAEAQAKFEALQKEAEEAQSHYQQTQAEQDLRRKEYRELEDNVISKRRELVTISQAQAHIQAQIVSNESRIEDLNERVNRAQAVWQELDTKRSEFEKLKSRAFEELEKERQMQLAIMSDVENFQANKAQIETSVNKLRSEVDETKDNLNKVSSRLYSLQKIDQSFEGFEEGVKNVMQWQQEGQITLDSSLMKLVADIVSTNVEYETALEACLGHKLQVILSQSTLSPKAALQKLKDNKGGRSSFMASNLVPQSDEKIAIEDPRVLTTLLEQVQFSDENYRQSVSSLLQNTFVVSSIEEAVELKTSYPKACFVTKEGETISAEGIISGGSAQATDSGLLRRRREIKELSVEKDQLDSKLQLAQRELSKALEQFQQIQVDLENAQKLKLEKEVSIAEKRKDLERAEMELKNAQNAIERQEREVESLNEQLNTLTEKLSAHKAEIEALNTKNSGLEEEVQQITERLTQLRSDVDTHQARTTELQVKAAQKTQEAQGLKNQLEMMSRSLNEVNEQISRMTQESSKSVAVLSQTEKDLVEQKTRIEQLIHKTQSVTQELALAQDEYEKMNTELRTWEMQFSDWQRKYHETQSSSVELKIKHEQLLLRQSNLANQVTEKYNVMIEDIYNQYQNIENDLATVESELTELRDKMSKMGEVNISAIEEYEELIKRYDFLSKQQNDLLESQAQLRKVIDRIDKICSKQFKETFESVNERFKRVFPILFGGGEAHLVLLESEDSSDPGVDIVVRPPGKKSQNITLLSGGEKALTSVALIFAIFLVKPSPFCLLDEVDAPLDDANVFRFNELVKEMAKRSQIIIVTHNKYTMEVNNKLYGVTMEEKGVSKMVSVDLASARKVANEATA